VPPHERGQGFFYDMAENKKSFLLYADLIHTIEKMPIDKAGLLFKHILEYVNDKNPTTEDLIINLTFEPIKQSLKRDLIKYESIRLRNSANGKKGGRPAEPKEPNGLFGNPPKPKQADNDSGNDSGNDKKPIVVIGIEKRKLAFANTLKPYLDKYGKDMLNGFYLYWTEPNKSNSKFKQELQTTWSLSRRLNSWAANDKTFTKPTFKNTPNLDGTI
jgi:hypothetical protein